MPPRIGTRVSPRGALQSLRLTRQTSRSRLEEGQQRRVAGWLLNTATGRGRRSTLQPVPRLALR
jgi:hypothetical protein